MISMYVVICMRILLREGLYIYAYSAHDRCRHCSENSRCLPLQRIEAPVRNNDSADKGYAYEGKDISDRQSDVDRLLVDQNQPEEQRFLGTAVAFPDALRFKGAAPEIVNSRYSYCPTRCNTHCTFPADYAGCLANCLHIRCCVCNCC